MVGGTIRSVVILLTRLVQVSSFLELNLSKKRQRRWFLSGLLSGEIAKFCLGSPVADVFFLLNVLSFRPSICRVYLCSMIFVNEENSEIFQARRNIFDIRVNV